MRRSGGMILIQSKTYGCAGHSFYLQNQNENLVSIFKCFGRTFMVLSVEIRDRKSS